MARLAICVDSLENALEALETTASGIDVLELARRGSISVEVNGRKVGKDELVKALEEREVKK